MPYKTWYSDSRNEAYQMHIQLITFSPTGTTNQIANAFAEGIGEDAKHIDLTAPENRTKRIAVNGDLVVLAAPVYGERIPSLYWNTIDQLEGRDTPLVGLAVYGNIGFGIGLVQFADYAKAHGFRLVGLGAFVGEHSYSNETINVGYGRPDAGDLQDASEFGKLIREKLLCGDFSYPDVPKPSVPKFVTKFPDMGTRVLIKQPSVDPALCVNCGICVSACPVGAIDAETLAITAKNCLRCYACVKKCPKNARRAAFRFAPFRKIFANAGKKHKENLMLF